MNLGVTRNRTNLYLSYRQSFFREPVVEYGHQVTSAFDPKFPSSEVDDLHRSLLNNDGGDHDGSRQSIAIEMDKLPPAWLDTPTEINDVMMRIAKQRPLLEKLIAKRLLPGFDDRSVEEDEIRHLTLEITKVCVCIVL